MADNLARVRGMLDGRPVKLVAVTKNASLTQIEEAFRSGVTEFGENRVQDALKKCNQLPPYIVEHVNWHFLGHLQTNKVKQTVGRFVLIHSVDSLRLAEELSRTACINTIQPILLQVKLVEDPSKSGFTPATLRAQIREIMSLPSLHIQGLMTIAPFTNDRFIWRRCFNGLKELRDELVKEHGVDLHELSMGMTADWREAIDCGSTIIRLGRAIFG